MQQMKQKIHECYDWAMQDKHRQKAVELKVQVERAFTEHPKETGETYLQHLWFTAKMTSRLAYSSVVLLMHGFFPFLFTHAASTQIEKIYSILRARIPQSRRDEINKGFDI